MCRSYSFLLIQKYGNPLLQAKAAHSVRSLPLAKADPVTAPFFERHSARLNLV
ncbi:MAG: hypothetical protein CM15mV135_050 [uncultured marine virus]|nr:MAG: hypothetical protein CM15mV135_050 [uncultured marine virus]